MHRDQGSAELGYQPVAYRWAHNLEAHDAVETEAFVKRYEAESAASAVILARTPATTEVDSSGPQAGLR